MFFFFQQFIQAGQDGNIQLINSLLAQDVKENAQNGVMMSLNIFLFQPPLFTYFRIYSSLLYGGLKLLDTTLGGLLWEYWGSENPDPNINDINPCKEITIF